MITLAIPDSPRGWEVMWVLSFAMYCILKLLSWSARSRKKATTWKHLAYLFAWPGMDAESFLFKALDGTVSRPRASEWTFAVAKLVSGLGLVFLFIPLMKDGAPYVIGWLGMIGTILCLHFGLFHLLSCFWRSCGVYANPIMNWPILATGLSDFWGQRWNLAFRDLTHRFVFRPMARRCGMIAAMLLGFVLSGLVHDLVISVPAGGGYGLPTLFFSLQGLGIVIEKSRWGRRFGLGAGAIGRGFAMMFLLAPLPLLFHRAFVVRIFYPFLIALGVTS